MPKLFKEPPPPAADTYKPWQCGYPMSLLRELAGVFKVFDKGMVLGAFTGYKENAVAAALADGSLKVARRGGKAVAAAVCAKHTGRRAINGFAGMVAGEPVPGAARVKRMAYLPGFGSSLLGLIKDFAAGCPEVWVETWVESDAARAVCEQLCAQLVNTKVMAGSELIGIYYDGYDPPQGPSAADLATLEKLNLGPLPVAAAVKALGGLTYADHYSSYNKGKTWSALALRGFGDVLVGPDPAFIIKPAEMSKKWKAENPETAEWECRDTPLRDALPALERLIDAVPGEKERIRLMRLAPGGGELTRHADITDRDAGTAPGKLMRIHIPLVTNPATVFTQWRLDGRRVKATMKAGEVWYLDTRKPHTAVNGGTTERIHLVMDVHSCPSLLKLLPNG